MTAKVKSHNLRTPIKPHDFQRLVSALATDIQIRFNPINERWQLWQVQTAPIEMIGKHRLTGTIMWTFEEADGTFRLPMYVDLERVKKTLANFELLNRIGAEAYADQLDKRDLAREKAINPDANDKIKQGAKEIANVLYKKQTHTHITRKSK